MKNVKRVFCGLGLLAGLLGFIVSLCMMHPSGVSVGSYSMAFGADFYTEIYQVTRDVGLAVNRMDRNICVCFGWCLLVFSLADLAAFGYLLIRTFSFVKKAPAVPYQPVFYANPVPTVPNAPAAPAAEAPAPTAEPAPVAEEPAPAAEEPAPAAEEPAPAE